MIKTTFMHKSINCDIELYRRTDEERKECINISDLIV